MENKRPVPRSVEQAVRYGFMSGWKAAAVWADRTDLIADVGSSAYDRDCDAVCALVARQVPLTRLRLSDDEADPSDAPSFGESVIRTLESGAADAETQRHAAAWLREHGAVAKPGTVMKLCPSCDGAGLVAHGADSPTPA